MSEFRAWAAQAWLELLFWNAAHLPIVPRMLKPVVLFLTWHVSGPVRRGTVANAGRILGEGSTMAARRRLGRGVLRSYYDSALDYAANRRKTPEEIRARIEHVEGTERYERARSLKRGAILVTAHLGPFETAVSSVRAREARVHVVFRRDPSPVFERLRAEQRARLGVLEAPVDDGLAMWFRLRDALRDDEVVLMQGDRTMPGQRGVEMAFLHGHIEIPMGPIKLAALSGAPIVPTFAVWTKDRGVRILICEPILVGSGEGCVCAEVAAGRVAERIAEVVRQYPEQWMVLEKAWVEDRRESRD